MSPARLSGSPMWHPSADLAIGDSMKVTTAVAVEKDKNSNFAVKWAIENLFSANHSLILVHVISRHGHLNRRVPIKFVMNKVQVTEVVVEETDVAKGLVEFINSRNIQNMVLGASHRLSFLKKFRAADVPTRVVHQAPDFCTVYVVAKTKVVMTRPAKSCSVPPSGIPPRHLSQQYAEHEEFVRTPFSRGGHRGQLPPHLDATIDPDRKSYERNIDPMRQFVRDRSLHATRTIPPSALHDAADHHYRPQRRTSGRDSASEDLDFLGSSLGFKSVDLNDQLEFTTCLSDNSHGTNSPTSSQRDLEAEMRRLRIELKQTMDMYSAACREAMSAKQKVQELAQSKLEEARIIEEARHAEEAAKKLAEIEKMRALAAMESAEKARRIAELEAQRRHHAEMKARREAEEKIRVLDALAHNDFRYRKYSIDEIEFATDNFSEKLKIGEGGYGPVYQGSLDHTPVAIKVLRPDAAQGRKQFHQEVEVLSCIRHPNMVLLLGACPEYGCLVYEYMDNGSLEDRLFRRGNTPVIPWSVRFRIAAEIATGLLFLHQAKPEPLVHRDLKPANILLDHNYTSKISDVGLSRLVPPSVADSVTQYRITSTAGTFCYIDPEYQQTGMLGTKSDIYSLGVLLLQLVTAKPPMGLTHHAERALERGTFIELLDPTVPDWPIEEVLGFARLALKCSELKKKDRPDLATVILPELNRLRNLGIAHEAGRSFFSENSSPGFSGTGPSSVDQEKAEGAGTQ
ncbi:kinase with adenine nucleotide alpha hydrolases-like domain-containing protein [Rhynchospora pubera]|uniref:RING-type E3 ubiquitin transferase n=1 Tax=Rhynchospora pubera TaxID=906938 RepID=A0AAV8G0J5_9POAL|nr:kinase with adenine nucleotide alpha hydrolases-like domain-containing protein [Rhynchospora pubera]